MTRDQIAAMAQAQSLPPDVYCHPGVIRLVMAAVAAEREECAKVCDGEFHSWIDKFSDGAVSVKTCAAAIRARGNT